MNRVMASRFVLLLAVSPGLLIAQHGAMLANAPHSPHSPSVTHRADADECPNYTGVLNSISVPVDQSLTLYVVTDQPAPDGGAYFKLKSENASVVAAGDVEQAYLPVVYIPAGETASGPFEIFGIQVGSTQLDIIPQTEGYVETQTPTTAWYVNPDEYGAPQDTVFLDANSELDTCRGDGSPNFVTDLSTCGANAYGTASDGVSKLLLRTVAGLAGEACYAIRSSSPPDVGSLTSAAVATTGGAGPFQYGYSFYTAPAQYGDDSDSRQVEIQFSFTPNIGNANTSTITQSLTVIRPPVVLIHGIWSSQDAWDPDVWDRSDYGINPSYITSFADYKDTNASSFSVNWPQVQDFVADGLGDAHDLGFAATQVDIVGHSMGGILTRLYVGSDLFKTPDNYNLGDIRRLVTLDTPHSGASTANLIVSMVQNSAIFGALSKFLAALTVLNINPVEQVINQGAVCDLAENSPALQGLSGGTNLPAQMITSTGGPGAGLPVGEERPYFSPLEQVLTTQICLVGVFPLCIVSTPLFPQDVVNGFRFLQDNDQIVAIKSQQAFLGGIGSYNTGYIHTTVETKDDVADQAFTWLDGPLSAFWIGLPPVESNGLGNPLTVVGLGAARDQSDYAKQCAPGRPLKPAEDAESRRIRLAEAASLKSFPVPAQSGDNRVQVTTPTNGQEFAPGASVNVTVTIAASISVARAFVGTTVPGLGPLTLTKSSGTTYKASFTIPSNYTGSLSIMPAVVDVNKNPIAGITTTVNVVPLTAPVSLSIIGGSYIHLRSVPSTSRLSVLGNYVNNKQLNLTASATGTTYSSGNTSVLTVDTEGDVQALAYGTSIVTVENKGVKTYAVFVVEQPASPLPPQDVTHSVTIASSGFQLNRNTGFFVQTVEISNPLSTPAAGPLYLVLEDLPAGVTLVGNQAGKTQQIPTVRSPYLKLKLPNGWLLPPGASLSLSLQFLNPNRVQISYTPKVYRTLGKP